MTEHCDYFMLRDVNRLLCGKNMNREYVKPPCRHGPICYMLHASFSLGLVLRP
jgi:hypothetical protein